MGNPASTQQPLEPAIQAGTDTLLSQLYDELRDLAVARMAEERLDHTLQPTALVHEAYLRIRGSSEAILWSSRGHFFAAAAEAMNRVLVEHARRRQAAKRGSELQRIELETFISGVSLSLDDMLDFHNVLCRLEEIDSQTAQVVKLRIFAGLSVKEAATALGVAVRSAYRDWAFAQAWLFRELNMRD